MNSTDDFFGSVNPFYQKVYNSLLYSGFDGVPGKLRRKFLKYVEHFILRGGTRLVKYELKGKSMLIPWTHNLPVALKEFPGYSHNTARIGKYISERFKNFTFIDIGANIGDTAVLQRSEAYYPVLCIEGDPFFFSLLVKNTESEKNVVRVKAFVGDEDSALRGEFSKHLGSGSISVGKGKEIAFKSLQTILSENPRFGKSKMLKIDTDGFDLKIIRGAKKFLKYARPVLFFEYDPYFIGRNGENGLSIFPMLTGLGYRYILIYDNLGDLLLTGEISNKEMLEDIDAYFSGRHGGSYCDLCVFHGSNRNLFYKIRSRELEHYRKVRPQ
jgi:FkbM family methyltransferase